MERRVPRVALSRVGTAAAAALTGLILLILMGDRASRWVRDYVQGRPAYLQDFSEIELIPPPPPWIKPGRAGLLAEIRRRSKHEQEVSVLSRDLEGIERDFLQCPWIRKVERIERSYPNRLTVRLPPDGYREPVARVKVGGAQTLSVMYLDSDCNVLPSNEIEMKASGNVLQIDGFEDLELGEKEPGHLLKFAKQVDGEPQPDSRLKAAARFAAYLKGRVGQGNAHFEPAKLRSIPGRGLWIWTAAGYYIIWGDAEDPEKNDDRWRSVVAWLGANPPPNRKLDQSLDASREPPRLVQIPLGTM